jgi:hypothetical protein
MVNRIIDRNAFEHKKLLGFAFSLPPAVSIEDPGGQ